MTARLLLAHLSAIPADITSGRLTGVPNPEQAMSQVVERRGLRRQRQVEQATSQPVGNRLPDRSRWQRREVVDDALDKRVRRAAKRP